MVVTGHQNKDSVNRYLHKRKDSELYKFSQTLKISNSTNNTISNEASTSARNDTHDIDYSESKRQKIEVEKDGLKVTIYM